jgi:hypothetical protein
MTITRRILWAGIGLVAFLWPLLLAPGIARANGIGDLYVGTASKVIEVHLAGKALVNTVDVPSGVTSLAFSPDGRTLYAATGKAEIAVIDIGTISAAPSLTAAGAATAVAHPSGDRLAVAIPDLSRVALLNPGDGTSTDVGLTGPGDLLAADRREAIVLAASTSGGWVSFIDASLGTSTTVPVDGRVVGLAIDRDTGGAYVATRNPNLVMRVDLGTHKTTWQTTLEVTPTRIAASVDGAVVAAGKQLLAVTAKGATEFATLASDAVAIAGSDDGKVVVAAMTDRVVAYSSSGGAAKSEVPLAKGDVATAIAPVPKPIVLDGAAGTAKPSTTAKPAATASSGGEGSRGGTARATSAGSRPAKPPTTSTDIVGLLPAGTPPVLGAVGVAVAILAAWWGMHFLRERRRRETLRRARVLAARNGTPLRRRRRPPPRR